LQDAFGTRLGRFTEISKAAIVPLTLTRQTARDPHIIVLGNAAQALHPIAGQGFNLAHRDVMGLMTVFAQHGLTSSAIASEFKKARQADRNSTIAATEWLVHSFSHQLLTMVVPRNVGLLVLQKYRQLRTRFTRLAMGYR
jgi:2-octaprenyl-6-methoxyphenol hydroxylase